MLYFYIINNRTIVFFFFFFVSSHTSKYPSISLGDIFISEDKELEGGLDRQIGRQSIFRRCTYSRSQSYPSTLTIKARIEVEGENCVRVRSYYLQGESVPRGSRKARPFRVIDTYTGQLFLRGRYHRPAGMYVLTYVRASSMQMANGVHQQEIFPFAMSHQSHPLRRIN